MGYTWAETIIQNTTVTKASHLTELHTNINLERISRALAGYTWTNTPTQYVTNIPNIDLTDMRTALDEAHTANVCSVHYAAKYSSHLNSNDSVYNNGQCSSVCGSYYNSNLGSDYTPFHNGDCHSNLYPHHNSVLSGQNDSHWFSQHFTFVL